MKKLICFLIFLLAIPVAYAQLPDILTQQPIPVKNATTPSDQPFAFVYGGGKAVAGENTTFTIILLNEKETNYIKDFDLTDVDIRICVLDECVGKSDQFLYKVGEQHSYSVDVAIPEKTIINITCVSEFRCYYVYDYPRNGSIQIGYKRFDKNFFTTYQSEFEIEKPINKTLSVNVTGQPQVSVSPFGFISAPFSANYLEIIGLLLFAFGMFMVLIKNKWGIILIILGIVLFIFGLVLTG